MRLFSFAQDACTHLARCTGCCIAADMVSIFDLCDVSSGVDIIQETDFLFKQIDIGGRPWSPPSPLSDHDHLTCPNP